MAAAKGQAGWKGQGGVVLLNFVAVKCAERTEFPIPSGNEGIVEAPQELQLAAARKEINSIYSFTTQTEPSNFKAD